MKSRSFHRKLPTITTVAIKLHTAVTYQGAKVRLAAAILDKIDLKLPLWDLCCGSGAVSIEAVNRGVSPSDIVMVDSGVWGEFWQSVGRGTFSLRDFERTLRLLPEDVTRVQGVLERLAREAPRQEDRVYVYLLLQAGAFGGKQIWIDKGKWCNCSFRSYWTPTETSSRRYPVNPMMPMPDELLRRVAALVESMRGVKAQCCDVRSLAAIPDGTAYLDPPYAGLTGYADGFDVVSLASALSVPCYVSEAVPLSPINWQLSGPRRQGGISGGRRNAHAEFLSFFPNKDLTLGCYPL